MESRRGDAESAGQDHDSFLDIVANIVGILIILVMVVTVRAKDAPLPIVENESVQTTQVDLAAPSSKLKMLGAVVEDSAAEIRNLDRVLVTRAAERDAMSTVVVAEENKIAQRREELDSERRAVFDIQRRMNDAQIRLAKLELQRIHLAGTETSTVQIESLPTPLSRTVLGDEVHFQLRGKRLAHIPLKQLVDEARSQLRHKLWKLDGLPEVTEIVGPREGFRIRYTLEKRSIYDAVNDRGGYEIRAKYWEAIPVTGQLGEPVEAAFAPHSKFRRILSGINVRDDTITVWTYPDSFDEFRRLKKELYSLGFSVAGRPLPEGVPIAGSPSGSRSAAQ
ncbi:MAG: hypothetical protein VB853_12795 [Pirellulales bacterium]